MCPAAVSTYADIGGSGANILELDGQPGKSQYETIISESLRKRKLERADQY